MVKKKKIAVAVVGLLVVCGIVALLAMQSCAPASAANEETMEETVEETVAEEAVVPTVSGITADSLSLVTNGEATANPNASVTGTNTDTVVFWYSASNESIAVDADGNVTAIEKTNVTPFVTIMAKYDANGDGVAAEDETTLESLKVAVTVTTNLEGISVNAASSDLEVYSYTGKTSETTSTVVTATAEPTGAVTTGVNFESSDPSVATVDSNGNVTAKGAGTATITATSDEGFTASCDIAVTRNADDKAAQEKADAEAAELAAQQKAAAEAAAAEALAAQQAEEAAAAAAATTTTDSSSSSSSSDTSSSSSSEGYSEYLYTTNNGDIYMNYNGGDDGLADVPDSLNGTTFID